MDPLFLSPVHSRDKFDIAIVCALQIESTAVEACFDELYDTLACGKSVGDTNAYSLGRIGQHSVVLTYLPSIGKVSAAGAAAGLNASFPNIRLCLLVGVCGAVPYQQTQDERTEIVLGDVIISTGIVQYDLGRQYGSGRPVRKSNILDNLRRLPPELSALIHRSRSGLGSRDLQDRTSTNIEQICQSPGFTDWGRPSVHGDVLFPSAYIHKHREPNYCPECRLSEESACAVARESTCEQLQCHNEAGVNRVRRSRTSQSSLPVASHLHWGLYASGDWVLRSGRMRDSIATDENTIAFEMEGAGLWERFPTLIIKGVCDYADSHKHKGWQKFAAVAASSAAKALLSSWIPHSRERGSPLSGSVTPDMSRSMTMSTSSIDAREVSVVDDIGPIWMVPFRQRESLIGRQRELEKLKSILDRSLHYSKAVIEGLGGIGKSRLALELAHQIRKAQPTISIFWLQCSDISSFERDCRALATNIGIPGADDISQDAKTLVKQYLDRQIDLEWLLILDGADDESLWCTAARHDGQRNLLDYIPVGKHGRILLTTRTHRIAANIAPNGIVRLMPLNEKESMVLFGTLLEQSEMLTNSESATRLLQQLTFLPLAIVQAAAFINQNNFSSVDEYLSLWAESSEQQLIEILSEPLADGSHYRDTSVDQKPVAITWLISFRQISCQHPIAAQLLAYMACLDHKDILRSAIPPMSCSPLDREKAYGTLRNYAFVQDQRRETSDIAYDMHQLVHLATRNYFRSSDSLRQHLRTVANHLCSQIPVGGINSSVYWRRYLSHAERVVGTSDIQDDPERVELQDQIATVFYESGAYDKSLLHREEVVAWLRNGQGENQSRLATSLSAVSATLRQLGRFEEALHLAEEAAEISNHVLDSQDPRRIPIMQALADAYLSVGRAGDALNLAEQIVQTSEMSTYKTQELRYVTMICAKQTLAASLHALQRWREQEKALLEAIRMCKKLRGLNIDIRRIELEMALGQAMCRLGKADLAIRRLQPINADLEKRFGTLHRLSLTGLSCLADAYTHAGQFKDAETLYRKLLVLFQDAGRGVDSHVLHIRDHLAHVIHAQGRYEEAKQMQIENVGQATQVVGTKGIFTLHAVEALAWSYWKLDRKVLACGILKSCAVRSRKAFGADNINTRKRYHTLDEWQHGLNERSDTRFSGAYRLG